MTFALSGSSPKGKEAENLATLITKVLRNKEIVTSVYGNYLTKEIFKEEYDKFYKELMKLLLVWREKNESIIYNTLFKLVWC